MTPVIPLLALLVGSASAMETFEGWAFYVGDPHVHTGVSGDGFSSDMGAGCGSLPCGALADIFDTATRNGLDWFATTDHTNGVNAATASNYAMLLELLLGHDDEGTGLVVVPAAEIVVNVTDFGIVGHRNIFFFGTDEQIAPLTVTDAAPTSSRLPHCGMISRFMEGLEATYGPVLAIPHHPCVRLPAPVRWKCVSEEYDKGVEFYSSFGNCLGGDWDHHRPIRGVLSDGTVARVMDPSFAGLKLAFLGGTDQHTTTPGDMCARLDPTAYVGSGGLTIVMVSEDEPWERAAIYEAILERRTLATTGPNLPLITEYRAGGLLLGTLGQDFAVAEDLSLDVQIRVPVDLSGMVRTAWVYTEAGGVPLDQAGPGAWEATLDPDEIPLWIHPALEIDGLAWRSEDACADGIYDETEWIWGSPSWLGPSDRDGDGFDASEWGGSDCDDHDPQIHPGAAEIWYDGRDQDCMGDSDFDADHDGFDAFEGGGPDCDDTSARVRPGGPEIWYDGIDGNCDGESDYDADADGFDTVWIGGDDCDDWDADVHPDAVEIWYDGHDQDCDDESDFDADRDGFDADGWGGLDCDDTDENAYPGAPELFYDGVDQDCEGGSDFDADADGYDAIFGGGDDCDDTNAEVNPSMPERFGDTLDSDCDGNLNPVDYIPGLFLLDIDWRTPKRGFKLTRYW